MSLAVRPWTTWDPLREEQPPPGRLLVEVAIDLHDRDLVPDYGDVVRHSFGRSVVPHAGIGATSLWDRRQVYLLPTRHPEIMCRTHRELGGYLPEDDTTFPPITDERSRRFRDFAENEIVAPIVRTQAELDVALPLLRATPSGCRALILEPGERLTFRPTDFGYWVCEECGAARDPDEETELGWESAECWGTCDSGGELGDPHRWIDWLILRGQTGPAAVPMHPAWVRSLVSHAAAAGVPVTFRGWGEFHFDRREFEQFSTWVNKAPTWVGKGAVCIDTVGNVLRRGADFMVARDATPSRFPVAIGYRVGARHPEQLLLDGEPRDDRPEVAR